MLRRGGGKRVSGAGAGDQRGSRESRDRSLPEAVRLDVGFIRVAVACPGGG